MNKNFLFLIISISFIFSSLVQSQQLNQLTLPSLSTPLPTLTLTLPTLSPPPTQANKPIVDSQPKSSLKGKVIFSQETDPNIFLIRAINLNNWQSISLPLSYPSGSQTITMWEPNWSPNGQKVVFVLWFITGEIYLVDLENEGLIQLTQNDFDDKNPAWSPDGKQIAFSSNRDGNYEIYLMDHEGKNQRRLTQNDINDFEPCWSPDGSQISFTSHRDGNNDIFTMKLDGSNLCNLTRNSADDSDPAWSPNRKQIAFSTNRDGNYEIYLMDTQGMNRQNLTHNLGEDIDPVWSPDGKQILFVSNRNGTYNLYLQDLNQDYAEPLFIKGYIDQIEGFFNLFKNSIQPDKNENNLLHQQILAMTNLILRINTYQLEFIEKPKYLTIWQPDWVAGE